MSNRQPSDDLLLATHQQFAENQRIREGLFVRLIALIGGVVAAYAFVFQAFRKNGDAELFGLTVVVVELLLALSAWLVCVFAQNFRRDQSVNARIRHEYGIIGSDGIYPRGYNPALSLGTRRFFMWMPDFYSVFYCLFILIELLVLASYAYRLELQLMWAGASASATVAVLLSTSAICTSFFAPILYYRKILMQLELLYDVSLRAFTLRALWWRIAALRSHIGQRQELRVKFWEAFRSSGELTRQAERVVTTQVSETHLHDIVVYHLVRANSLLRATTAACEAGYAKEALLFLRSLFLLNMNLRWLMTGDTEEKVQRFAHFEAVRKHLSEMNLNEYGVHPVELSNREGYQIAVEKYGLSTEDDLTYWPGLSPQEMADELGMTNAYHLVFGRVLDYDITSPGAMNQYMEMTDEGLAVRWSASEEEVEFTMREAIRLFVEALKHFLMVFDVSDTKLQRLIAKNEEIYREFVTGEDTRTQATEVE